MAGSRSTPKDDDDKKSETPAVEPSEEYKQAMEQGYIGEVAEDAPDETLKGVTGEK
jgi:hypothetical protein